MTCNTEEDGVRHACQKDDNNYNCQNLTYDDPQPHSFKITYFPAMSHCHNTIHQSTERYRSEGH